MFCTRFNLIIIMVLFFMTQLSAKRGPQNEQVWVKSDNGKYQCLVETRTGTVTVVETGKRNKILWKIKIKGFSSYFSKVYLSDTGDYLIHNKSNHRVRNIADTALEIHKKNGKSKSFQAKDFIDKLQENKRRTSVCPKFLWLKHIGPLKADSFSLINAKGEEKTIKVKKQQP